MKNKGFTTTQLLAAIIIFTISIIIIVPIILNNSKEKAEHTNKPNEPILMDNLIPIRYDGINWKYADIKEEWYNYNKKEWANAVVLNTTKKPGDIITEADIDLWYVWVPRFKYQIFNDGRNNDLAKEQAINIVFEEKTSKTGEVKCIDDIKGYGNKGSENCINVTKDNYYTHPAFTFGEKELTGIWVAKFEVSANNDKITIKPNVESLTNKSILEFHKMIRKMEKDYNINGDTHMIKNMEWGAVAYLAHSNYGLCENNACTDIGINNSINFEQKKIKTGYGTVNEKSYPKKTPETQIETIPQPYNTKSGVKASTTQNVYGIYDLSGGAAEYTMGNIVDYKGKPCFTESGITNELDGENSKYYDKYSYNDDYTNYTRGKLGDGIKETINSGIDFSTSIPNYGWTGDYSFFPVGSYSWFVRSGFDYGKEAGLFAFYGNGGGAESLYGTRGVIVE